MTDGRLQWHSGFSAALRVELEDELDELCIEDEHMLSKKPMQIDVLVVKKKGEQPIRKNSTKYMAILAFINQRLSG